MHKYTQALKISALAIVLSFGLSYVYAWTAPTATPPNGNISAPINTSAVSQTKAGDIAINNAGHFLDTGTTIPETPAGGSGAIALNGWPNFSDVAGNAVKLAGLTSADILSAQTGGGTSGVQTSMMTFWSGSATCPVGWTKAFTGVANMFYAVPYNGSTPLPLIIDGVNNTNANAGTVVLCTDGMTGVANLMWGGKLTNSSCTVCAR